MCFGPFFGKFFSHNFLANAPIELIFSWVTLYIDTKHDPLGIILLYQILRIMFFLDCFLNIFWPFLAIFDQFSN